VSGCKITLGIILNTAEHQTMALSIVFPFFKLKNLHEIIKDAYSNPSQCGAARRLLGYGIIQVLASEFSNAPLPGMQKQAMMACVVRCKLQME
jgi:hypothetical protein